MEDTRRRDQINRIISKYQFLPPEDRERVLTLLASLIEEFIALRFIQRFAILIIYSVSLYVKR